MRFVGRQPKSSELQIMMEFANNAIHLWMTDFGWVTDEPLLARYLALLTPKEKEQYARFQFAVDRTRYLVTRALVRTVLSRYVPLPPEAWRFAVNSYGRPHIINDVAEAAKLSFNISHTNSLIILGVTTDATLGVDVENRRNRAVTLEVADHYFAPEEVRCLRAASLTSQSDRFFDYWTLKEAYIKAKGIGLSMPLDRFSFGFPTDTKIAFSVDKDLGDDATYWRFWQYYPADEYVVAICVERVSDEAPEVLATSIIPATGEARFELPDWRRRSF
jgi:4'-phosphopantetheinyl transferase